MAHMYFKKPRPFKWTAKSKFLNLLQILMRRLYPCHNNTQRTRIPELKMSKISTTSLQRKLQLLYLQSNSLDFISSFPFFPCHFSPSQNQKDKTFEKHRNNNSINNKMASLATNITAFLFLFPAGLRRLVCSSSIYMKNPSLYRSKPWFFSDEKLKNLDLYFLIISLPIASFSEFFFFLTFSGHPTYKYSFFMQSASLFIFWVLILVIVFRESYDSFLVDESFVYIFAAVSFIVEYSVIGKGIVGVGGVVYELLGDLTLVCASACLVLSIRPTAFFAEFFLSCGLIFKGIWLLQAGFSLYTDAFAFKGCHKISLSVAKGIVDVKCDLEEDGFRGEALVNLLFVANAFGVFIGSCLLFALLSRFRNSRFGEASGRPLLAHLESDTKSMRQIPEFELE